MSVINNEITTSRQARNRTRAFLCERTGATYLSYVSGYVRRQKKSCNGRIVHYQLNKRAVTVLSSVKINGRTYKTTTVKRIMILEEADRLVLIEKCAESYKPRV